MNVVRQGIASYTNWLDDKIIIPFTRLTDLSDVSNPLSTFFISEVMIEYVQARINGLITC